VQRARQRRGRQSLPQTYLQLRRQAAEHLHGIYYFTDQIYNNWLTQLKTFGGTNWGNLGFMGGSTSYDYGAAISENRHVSREKYSETKIQAHFLKVSPAYLTALPGQASNTSHTDDSAITVTPLVDREITTQFWLSDTLILLSLRVRSIGLC
jgi:hypothetical protein